MKEVGIF